MWISPNAVSILARKYQIYIPEESPHRSYSAGERRGGVESPRADFKERLYMLHEKMQMWYANRLLQAGGANELYCKNRRDAIVIFAISHGYTLQKTEEELYRFDEATIS